MEIFIQDNLKMVLEKVKELFIKIKEQFIHVVLKMINKMDKVFNLFIEYLTFKVNVNGKMEENIKENEKMI